MPTATPTDTAIWRPQPGPQHALIDAGKPEYFIDEIFFGGARGGGKTDGMLGEFAVHAQRYGRNARGIVFRRSLPQLEDMIARSRELYEPLGSTWFEQKKTWRFSNGATLRFRALERDKDAEKYQGHAYTRVYFEELTNFPSPGPYLKMFGVLRSAAGVPCGIRSTGNPGGPGHNWVKARFITAGPPMKLIRETVGGYQFVRVFIPSKLNQNPALMSNDPRYVARLHQSGHADLVKAWLEGDWDIVAGGMFDDVWRRDIHVINPFDVPESWELYRAFDWGSAKPFAVQWWAATDGEAGPAMPRNTAVLVAQWYGSNGQPNEGLRLSDTEIGRGIVTREAEMGFEDRVLPGPADSSIFPKDNNDDCPYDALAREGAYFVQADKSPGSRVRGVQVMRRRLKNSMPACDDRGDPVPGWRMESPGLFVFNTCLDFIRTIPTLPRAENNPEDVDTTCFRGSERFLTPDGSVSFADAAGTSGLVMTRFGWQPYRWCRRKPSTSEVVEVIFADGNCVVCTPDHRFLTEESTWVEAQNLTGLSCMTVKSGGPGRATSETVAASRCTVGYGNMNAGRSLRGMRSTMLTAMATTTPSTISNASRVLSIARWSRETSTPLRPGGFLFDVTPCCHAAGVVRSSRHAGWPKPRLSTAPSAAAAMLSMRADGHPRPARSAGSPSCVASKSEQARRVATNAAGSYVVAVRRLLRREPVFCINVPRFKEFTLESGVIVHNSEDHDFDAARYMLTYLPEVVDTIGGGYSVG